MSDFERERREAVDAGENALRSLRNAKSELRSARGWGIYDILKGGMISTAIKHSKMSNAARDIEQARWDLQKFSREVSDVTAITGVDFAVGDFAIFADYFFDGLIADFYMQSKIKKALAQVDEAIYRVENILSQLRRY